MAATRLHLALLQSGVDSHFICVHKKGNGPNVYELPNGVCSRKAHYIITRIIWLLGYLTPFHRVVMPNIIPLFSLKQTLKTIHPDIVHIHWYMLDTISFPQLSSMPCHTVMTLHDLFGVNIEEPYPASDRRFIDGLTPSNTNWYERWLFRRKCDAMLACRPTMTGPSQWICNVAKASIIGRNLQYAVVGNIFDRTFTFEENRCKSHGRFCILFGAYGGRCNPKKGWKDFIRAIPLLSNDVRVNSDVFIFGETAEEHAEHGLQIKFLGELTSADQLKNAYHTADVLILPSLEDNAPNVKFEAWLCGTPVIAFNRTGCAEHIIQKENGWVARDGNFGEFAEGIAYFYRLFKDGLLPKTKEHIAQWAQKQFNEHAVLDALKSVYSNAITNSSRHETI